MKNKIFEKQMPNIPEKIDWCKKNVLFQLLDQELLSTKMEYVLLVKIKIIRIINWKSREEELKKLLDKHRSRGKSWDVIVPSSGRQGFFVL